QTTGCGKAGPPLHLKRSQGPIAGSENLGICIDAVNDGVGILGHSDQLRCGARPMNRPPRFVPNLPEPDATGSMLGDGSNKILPVLVSARPIRVEVIRRGASSGTVPAVGIVAVGRRPRRCSCHG